MVAVRPLLLAAAVVASLLILLYSNSNKIPSVFSKHNGATTSAGDSASFPRKIWQTWRDPAQSLEEELQRFSRSWVELNSDYRYEVLTDEGAVTFVRDKFGNRQDIINVFEENNLKIFRADFLRYLVLLADGGVYTDIDTDCTKPIKTWVPSEYLASANLVVGLEFDAQGEEISEEYKVDFLLPVRLVQWSFVAKPGNGALEYVVNRVEWNLRDWWKTWDKSTLPTRREVLDITGPSIFTRAIFEYLSARQGRDVPYSEISNIIEPLLIGDVLFLPVSAFASGQEHSGSKPWGNPEQLLSHHWRGSWLKDIEGP